MPFVGLLTAGVDFASLKIILKQAVIDDAGKVVTPETAITYGQFINITIDFILVSFVMFMIVKAVNKAKKKKEETPTPPEPSNEEKLLTEIRDLLKNK
jgi:large conductance mechanosensitive channel